MLLVEINLLNRELLVSFVIHQLLDGVNFR